MVTVKAYKTDGETRVGVWVNNTFKEEVDTHQGFNTKQAKQYLRDKYCNNINQKQY